MEKMNWKKEFKKQVLGEKEENVLKKAVEKSSIDDKMDYAPGVDMLCGLFECLSSAQVQMHFWHLETESYELHKVTQNFYEEIRTFTDSFLEELVGDFGRIKSGYKLEIGQPICSCEHIIRYTDDIINKLCQYKKMFPEEYAHHKNKIEEFISFCSGIKYKLTLN